MHVLVTGGAGFIGSHSVERLLARGARVRVLDNFSSGKAGNLPAHAALETIRGDVRDRQAVDHALEGIDHVLHLAAQVSVAASVANPIGSSETNVGGFLNVLDAARQRQVKRFVYASSSAVYGIPGLGASSESTAPAPISPYGLEKQINDLYAGLYGRLYGVPALGLRYFNVFGPRQDASSPYSGVISIFMRCLRQGEPLTIYGDGHQTRDFVYVGDVAELNARALESATEGVCNVGTGGAISLLDLVSLVAQCAGRPTQTVHLSERVGDIRHSSADNARLRQAFDFNRFTSVATGLERLWCDHQPQQ